MSPEVSANLPGMSEELGFLGGATFYRNDSKVDVDVRRYFSTDAAGAPNRWWGEYEIVGDETLTSGAAHGRFSDGSEADISLEATSERTGGSSQRVRSPTRLNSRRAEAEPLRGRDSRLYERAYA